MHGVEPGNVHPLLEKGLECGVRLSVIENVWTGGCVGGLCKQG